MIAHPGSPGRINGTVSLLDNVYLSTGFGNRLTIGILNLCQAELVDDLYRRESLLTHGLTSFESHDPDQNIHSGTGPKYEDQFSRSPIKDGPPRKDKMQVVIQVK